MSVYSEDGIEKLTSPPLVQDTTHPDHTDDDDGAAGAMVAIHGAPSSGDVPTFDGTKFVPLPPGAAPTSDASNDAAIMAARQAFEDARVADLWEQDGDVTPAQPDRACLREGVVTGIRIDRDCHIHPLRPAA